MRAVACGSPVGSAQSPRSPALVQVAADDLEIAEQFSGADCDHVCCSEPVWSSSSSRSCTASGARWPAHSPVACAARVAAARGGAEGALWSRLCRRLSHGLLQAHDMTCQAFRSACTSSERTPAVPDRWSRRTRARRLGSETRWHAGERDRAAAVAFFLLPSVRTSLAWSSSGWVSPYGYCPASGPRADTLARGQQR